ncbi:MAG: hypothetical protein WBA16_06735 [Nonlabens sp.]
MDWNYKGAFDSYSPSVDNEVLQMNNETLDFLLLMLIDNNGLRVEKELLTAATYYVMSGERGNAFAL